MKLKFLSLLLVFALPVVAIADEIVVQNRILATVNGKNISVMDVMKKMDVYLAKAYPEYAKSNQHRYQFFSQNWQRTLNQIIDNELIVADAKKLEMKIGDAEIREMIHERFGPNVVASLDELGLTFDEAWDMLYNDIAAQRMTWYRVYSKAHHRVGPQTIKLAFQDHVEKNPPKEEWKYQVISIKGKTEQLSSVYAQKAQALLKNEPLPFEELAKQLIDKNEDPSVSITVSDEYCVETKALSDSHKTVVCSLTPGTYSEPTEQISRDKSVVHRIFYLKDHTVNPPAKFDTAMVDSLQDELMQKVVEKEYPLYIAKLRKQFNFDEKTLEALPTDFQPFSLL